jgi:CheY-like chemotaxis protein
MLIGAIWLHICCQIAPINKNKNMNTNKLNILIVEDKPENIAAAKRFLVDHSVTVVSGFDQAMGALNRGLNGTSYNHDNRGQILFDVVLTDCMFPKGGMACMGPKGQAAVNCQGEMPYGPMVVFHAIEAGVPNIGLITQGNHHDDPFVFAFDTLKGWKSEKVSVAVTSSLDRLVYVKDGEPVDPASDDYKDHWKAVDEGRVCWVKDWSRLLERVLGTEASHERQEEIERRQI